MFVCSLWTSRGEKVFENVWFAILYIFCKVLLTGVVGKNSIHTLADLFIQIIIFFILPKFKPKSVSVLSTVQLHLCMKI